MKRLLPLIILVAASPAFAQSERDAALERRQEIERVIDAREAEREAIKAKAGVIEKDIDGLRDRMKAAAAAMREKRGDAAAAARAAQAAAKAADDAAKAIDRRRRELSSLLGAMARLSLRPPEALAALKNGPAEAAKASLAFQALLPEVERRIEDARAALAEAANLQSVHLARAQDADAATAALKAERLALDRAVADKRSLLSAASQSDAALGDETRKLAAEAKSIDGLIAAIAAREAAAEAARRQEAARAKAAAEAKARAEAEARARAEAAARAAAAAKAVAEAEAKAKAEAAARAAAEAEAAYRKAEAAARKTAEPTITPPFRLAGIAKSRGQATQPVAGKLAARFGQGEGVNSRGWVFEASAGAEVFAPFDGRIVYAGPFRGYGAVALIDHGDGYHSLLTGLDDLSVAVGDWVLQGEPVGALPPDSGGGASEPRGPKLYVELRKDGEPVDPAPWFVRPT